MQGTLDEICIACGPFLVGVNIADYFGFQPSYEFVLLANAMATVSGTTQPIDKTYVRNQPYLSCLGVDELIYPPFYAASLKYNSEKTRRNLAHDMIEISRVCFTTLHQYLSSLLSMKTVQDTLWWSVIRIISKMSSIRLIQSLAKRGSVASSKDKG